MTGHTVTRVVIAPGGCRWCGVPERDHCWRWTSAAGWHQWIAPADAQRLARMRTRRAARLLEKEAAPGTSGGHQEPNERTTTS
jgi:hypothetical protein